MELPVLTTLLDVLEWLIELPQTVFHGYSSLIRWAADSVHSLYDDYGYWVVFFGTFFENTLFLGVIIPGVLVVILAGISAEDGSISVPLATALGIAGTVLGDTLSYLIGRYGWRFLGQGKTMRDLEEKVRGPLLRRGRLFVLVYHFFGYTRLVGPATAGFLKMPYRQWAPADYAGASLWVTAYMGIGYGLGALGLTLDSTDRYFRVIEWALLVVVVIVGYKMYQVAQREWAARQRSAEVEAAAGRGGA
jgi:undecaprenyl-diphosphatase